MEVYHNGEWGTVCDDGWDLNDAQVICRELDLGAALGSAFYGEGSGVVWLNGLNCVGSEFIIGNCSHRGWGIGNCSHSQDVGLKCSSGNCIIIVPMYVLYYHIYSCMRHYYSNDIPTIHGVRSVLFTYV